MIGNVRKEQLKQVLQLQESRVVQLVIALGKPVEEVVLEEAAAGVLPTCYRGRSPRRYNR
jgi:hypothetical protein